MDLPISRTRTGLLLLALGAVFIIIGMLFLGGAYGGTALVVAVVLLTAGTLLYGTSTKPEPPGRSTQ